MRLDHLLSKEEKSRGWIAVECSRKLGYRKLNKEISGGDALRGNTRTHPEHDG